MCSRREKKDELLLLIALSGELPADWTGRAVGSESYGAALVTRLKKEGYIKLRGRDGLRGYVLRARARAYLMERYRGIVEAYLSGFSETSHVKSEPDRRLRLHRMSMVWIFMQACKVRIFNGEKPELFPGSHTWGNPRQDLGREMAAYYGTKEFKEAADKEILGSRACGLLASGAELYVVYNTMDSVMRWSDKTERNVKSRMESRFLRGRGGRLKGAVILGKRMEMAGRLLKSTGGIRESLFQLGDVYERYYYIPMEPEAELEIRLLCSRAGREKLYAFLCSALCTVSREAYTLEAGTDERGIPVYFCYLTELWHLRRLCALPYGKGRVFCFTYQAAFLRELLPEWLEIEAIRPDKVRRYLKWEGQEG